MVMIFFGDNMSHIIMIKMSLKIKDKEKVLQALTRMGLKVSMEHKVTDYYGNVTTIKNGVVTFELNGRWFTIDDQGNLIGDTYGMGDLPINTAKFAVLLGAALQNGKVKRIERIGDGWQADVEERETAKFSE